jgi:hypothetical protein
MEDSRKLKGGSGNKKMKKFPRVIDYLEAHHKDIYDLFDDLAMHSALTPRRGGSITFLLPDTAVVSQIRKAIESDRPEDATDMLSALILTDLFESPSDFQEKQDDIPNLLGKRLVVKGVSGSKVTLESGELVVDPKFKPFERQGTARRGNLAVWLLKGKVDHENAPAATHKYAKLPPKPKKGGNEASELVQIIKNTLRDEVECVAAGVRDQTGFKSPMLNAVARLLRVFQSNAQFADECQKAKALLTKQPVIDFYLLFHNPDVFHPARVLQAWKLGVDNDSNVDTIRNFHNVAVPGAAAVLTPQGLAEANRVRDEVRNQTSMNIKTANNIVKLYDDWDQTNKLVSVNGVVNNVFPESLANLFRLRKGMHLALDEFKFYAYSALQQIRSSPADDTAEARALRAKEYANLFSSIHECYPKLGARGVSLLLTPLLDKNDVQFVQRFWNTFGLSLPSCCEAELTDRVVRGGDEDCDTCDLENIDAELEQDLAKFSNCELSLSPCTVAELKSYMKRHGKLPDL